MKKKTSFAVGILDENNHILVHMVEAYDVWNAFRNVANAIEHDFDAVFAMPWGRYKRSKIEFPGEGIVGRSTILDPEQVDVFPPDSAFKIVSAKKLKG